MGPRGRYAGKNGRKISQQETGPVGCEARIEVGAVGPLGHARREKREENLVQGNGSVGYTARTGSDCGGPLGTGAIKQEE